jgi:hypothetical protein
VDGVDFTRASEQIARDVAEDAGLSTTATNTMRTAITLHYSPGVTRAQGPVAYLLSAAGSRSCAATAHSTWPSTLRALGRETR